MVKSTGLRAVPAPRDLSHQLPPQTLSPRTTVGDGGACRDRVDRPLVHQVGPRTAWKEPLAIRSASAGLFPWSGIPFCLFSIFSFPARVSTAGGVVFSPVFLPYLALGPHQLYTSWSSMVGHKRLDYKDGLLFCAVTIIALTASTWYPLPLRGLWTVYLIL